MHNQTPAKRRYLYSPFIDFMLAGGLSLILLPLLFVLFPLDAQGNASDNAEFYVSVAFAFLAYLVNNPHFIASYHLLYDEYRKKLLQYPVKSLSYWRYVNAGIIVPVGLTIYLIYAFIKQDNAIFAYGIEAMFFFVGWHYVKQAFGVFIVLSSLKTIFYSARQRRVFLINAFLVWMTSWLGGNIWVPGFENSSDNMDGITFSGLNMLIPPFMLEWLTYCSLLYGVLSATCVLWHAYKTQKAPSLSGLSGYCSMYSLLILSYYHPLWIYMTPFLHSAQYLLFVSAYKKGEHSALIDNGFEEHQATAKKQQFIMICFLLGVLCFTVMPASLQGLLSSESLEYGTFLPFIYAFGIFINIHHYFIDNVIWRKDNPKLSPYLGLRS